MAETGHNNSICYDILQFQDALKKMRALDDKIIYTFNTSMPTDSFRTQFDGTATCKTLYDSLQTNYRNREESIKRCIDLLADEVRNLKKTKDTRPDDLDVSRNLRREQTSLRLLRTELGVEEVIRERTLKVFHERCRDYYIPPM